MEVSESVEMASFGTLGGRKEVREKHHVVLWITSVCSLVIDGGREGSMTALAEVLADNFVFVQGQEGVEGLANKSQVDEIGGIAVAEDFDLNLDR